MPLPPSNPPRWTFAVATMIWAMLVGFAARFAIAVFVPAIGGPGAVRWLVSTPLGLAVGAAIIQLALLATALLRSTLMPELRQRLYRGMRLQRSHAVLAVFFIVGLAPLANVCGISVAKLIGTDLESIEFVGRLVRSATWYELLVLTLALTVLPAIVEESIFRGLVLGSLDELRPPVALLLSSLAFGAFHLDVAQGVATAILGLGFGYIVQTTGSLLGAMLAHGIYNLFVLATQRFLPVTEMPAEWQFLEMGAGLAIAALAGYQLRRLGRGLGAKLSTGAA